MSNQKSLRLFTEHPIESLWEQLSLYESNVLAKKLISEKTKSLSSLTSEETINAKATALSSCLRNARENLTLNSASLTITVTANYYGCLWLNAAIAIADPSNDADLAKLERSTKGGHGLHNVANEAGGFPDSEYVFLRETGLLADLLKWNGMSPEMLKTIAPKSSIKEYGKASESDKKLLVSLPDLLARVPELKGLYETVLNKRSLCMTLVSDVQKNMSDRLSRPKLGEVPQIQEPGHFWLQLLQTANLQEAEVRSLAPPVTELIEIPGKDWTAKVLDAENKPWSESFPTYHSTLAGTWRIWIKPLLGVIQEPLFIHLMSLYQLSILARYRPAVWHEILEGEYDQYRVLIQSYARLFCRVGPELALNRLINRNVLVIPPGGLYGPGN